MRLVYVTACWPWGGNFGGALRCAGILRGLTRRHDVEVAFCPSTPERAAAARGHDPPMGARALHVLAGPSSSGGAGDGRGAFRQACAELIARLRPDVVWLFERQAARLVGCRFAPPVVLDLDGVAWRRLARQARRQPGRAAAVTLLRGAAAAVEEIGLHRRVAAVLLSNATELGLLGSSRRIHLVRNGRDFPPLPPPLERRDAKRLLHIGSLWYPPTLDGVRWFCRAVWPRVLAAEPGARLDVGGWSEAHAAELGAVPGVTVHGLVGDLTPLWRETSALVVPLHFGAGTRMKILEAWARGVPVVATTIGAEGLGAVDQETALIADDPVSFAEACLRLLRDPARGAALARRGFEYGRTQCSWEAVHPALDAVVASVVKAGARARARG